MSEDLKNDDTALEQPNNVVANDPFSDESWSNTPVKAVESTTTEVQVASPASNPTKDDEEILDPKEFLKREFDTDDVSVLKAEREELKSLREKATSLEFKNEDSRKVFEYLKENKEDDLYDYLSNKKKIDKLSNADLTDKKVAAELVKFSIQKDNPNLNDEEVEFLYNKKFSVPPKPIQGGVEDDEEYQSRVTDWEIKKANAEKELIIEAKMAQPKMAQLKAELILPDISPKENQSPKQKQEDLDAFTKMKDSFLQSAESSINGFTGFSVPVKDKDVDYTVSYAPSQEEKTFVNGKIKEFAETGFDANALLAERWVSDDGKTLKVDQMVKDLSMVYSNDKIFQKLVTDSANKRIESYLKEKKQINVNETNATKTFNPSGEQTELDKVREQAFS